MIQPLVKVVVTSYNRPVWLREAVESVLAQTYQHLHVIIVDDASNPETVAEVKRLAADFPERVSFVLKPENRGVAHSIVTGIRAAPDAPFVAFLNDDDRWYPEKLELQLPLLTDATVPSLVYSDSDVLREEEGRLAGKSYIESCRPIQDDDLLDWLASDRVPPPTLVVNRALAMLAIEAMPERCLAWDYFLILLARGHGPLRRADQRLAMWRSSATGQHQNKSLIRDTLSLRAEVFRQHPEFVKQLGGIQVLRRQIATLSVMGAQRRLRERDLTGYAWCAAMVLKQRNARAAGSLVLRTLETLLRSRIVAAHRGLDREL